MRRRAVEDGVISDGQLSFDWAEIARARQEPRLLFEEARPDALRSLTEGQYFERKGSRVDPRALAISICAFSNTDARGGLIIVGIADDGTIEGIDASNPALLNRLQSAGRDLCPQAQCRQRLIEIDGRELLLILVEYHTHRVVELTGGSVYLRVADTNRKMEPEEVVRLRQDKGEMPFELEPLPNTTLHDLDPGLYGPFVEAVRTLNHLEFDRSAEDVLLQRRLLRSEAGRRVPLTAALLLFGNDPIREFPGCKVRFIRYEGTEERTGQELNVVKDHVVEGPVPILIKQAAEITFSQLREFQALQPDGRFQLVPEYPRDCVYEAIVNACVHRSYAAKNMNVFIRMFDDRLEIESPGGFVPPVTADNIYEQHVPRNPILMDALRYLRLVRCASEGTRRMRHLMEAAGLPHPRFRQESDRLSKVVVTLRNNIEQRKTWIDRDLSTHVGAQLAASLDADEIRVLNFVAENQRINVSDTQRISSRHSWSGAKRLLEGLVAKGLLRFVSQYERDPKAHYTLAEGWRPNGKR